jgi:hypothetical protein
MGVDTTGTAGAGCSLAGCDAVVNPPAPLGARRGREPRAGTGDSPRAAARRARYDRQSWRPTPLPGLPDWSPWQG